LVIKKKKDFEIFWPETKNSALEKDYLSAVWTWPCKTATCK